MELAMNLPDDVVRRLAEYDALEHSLAGFSVSKRGKLFEARGTVGRVEIRATENSDDFALEGYAALWDVEYDVLGGPPIGWTEVVRREAVTSALAGDPDIRFLIDHAGIPLARTKSGTLKTAADDVGLKSSIPHLDMANPDVQRVRSAVDRGDIDQMSWAFRVAAEGQKWNDEMTYREIVGVRSIFDESLVTFAANPATAMGRSKTKAPETKRSGLSPALARALLALD